MISPNWFVAVMGTGIIAVAADHLPYRPPGTAAVAAGIWALAAALLVLLGVATALHWRWFPATARGHGRDATMRHFYGAPAMALLTVGAGALLVGGRLIGQRAAVDLDWTLWVAGTLFGLATAAGAPLRGFLGCDARAGEAFGGWLMPVVPPMVSASTGALLLPDAVAGQPRLDLLVCCYALFGMSLVASLVIITLIWQRLTFHDLGEARTVPTLWIVLGPLGQSVTAANLLGAAAHVAVPGPLAAVLHAFGFLYGVPTLGFALLWMAIAVRITWRTAATSMPFALSWWSFTFPVGTCVTGAASLAALTGSVMVAALAMALFGLLVSAWLVVAARTLRGAWRGELLQAPRASAAATGVVVHLGGVAGLESAGVAAREGAELAPSS